MGPEVPVCGYLELGGALQCMTQRMERNKGLNAYIPGQRQMQTSDLSQKQLGEERGLEWVVP